MDVSVMWVIAGCGALAIGMLVAAVIAGLRFIVADINARDGES